MDEESLKVINKSVKEFGLKVHFHYEDGTFSKYSFVVTKGEGRGRSVGENIIDVHTRRFTIPEWITKAKATRLEYNKWLKACDLVAKGKAFHDDDSIFDDLFWEEWKTYKSHWASFIKTKDLGISFMRIRGYRHYRIVDKNKWLLTKIKYEL
jgi:hypothetical protein